MPIKEESFRIGCGRYIQGRGYARKCGEEVARIGSAPFIIGDTTALSVAKASIEEGMVGACEKYEFCEYNGSCNDESAEQLAKKALSAGYDVIVGVGGGVIMDFAKLCADFAKLPIINLPTSSATCAAFTPLSVRYTPEGRTVGSKHYGYEVNGVVVDTEIISAQPVRLLLAGVFDALAKLVEIKHRYMGDLSADYDMGLNYAYVMSEHSFELLNQKTAKCIEDMKKGEVTRDLEEVIFTSICATGVISGIARGSNQCALGHKFYEAVRAFLPEESAPYLHGEIVGVGLLLQNHYNGEVEHNEGLLKLMRENGMPCSVESVGVPCTEEWYERFYDKLCHCSSIDASNADECKRLAESLRYLWNIK